MPKRTVPILLALLMLAVPALAEEEKPAVEVASKEKAKHELKMFDREFDTVDIDFKLDAVKRLSKCVHPDVEKKLTTLLFRDKDVHVRAEAAKGLRYQIPYAKKIGKKVLTILKDDKVDAKILENLIYSVGLLKYTRAWEPITDLLWHDEDRVVIAGFWVLGEWKELRSHREFQNFWDMYPEEGKFKTGTVTVDTGTAGDGDQRAAKAKWKAKYGSAAKRRPRPECVKAMKAAVKKITGEELKSSAEWRAWVKKNKIRVKAAERKKD